MIEKSLMIKDAPYQDISQDMVSKIWRNNFTNFGKIINEDYESGRIATEYFSQNLRDFNVRTRFYL